MINNRVRNSLKCVTFFLESRTRKQVVDEQRKLLKYAQIKSLGNILYE